MYDEDIKNIIQKYYREEDECYSPYRYEDDETEVEIIDEIEQYLTKVRVQHKVVQIEGYNSSGYENLFLYAAWVESENLRLHTAHVLLEVF